MTHPITTAILNKNLKTLKELATTHEKELDNITSNFQNPTEDNRQPKWDPKYFNWKFVPDTGERVELPLETAARIGWLPGVRLLLDHGASVRHGDRLCYMDPPCAILWACKEGHADVVRLLLERGADVECTHSKGDNCEDRTPFTVALNYCQLAVVKVLVEYGVNINENVSVGTHSEPPLSIVCHESGMPLFRYLIGAGADVENGDRDWSGSVGLWMVLGHAPKKTIEKMLILFLQAGHKISANGVVGLMQDWYDHMGGCGRSVPVPEPLREFTEGKLYKLSVEDRCRIETRRKLIEAAGGRSILPAIKQLPLPDKMKNFIAFGCLSD